MSRRAGACLAAVVFATALSTPLVFASMASAGESVVPQKVSYADAVPGLDPAGESEAPRIYIPSDSTQVDSSARPALGCTPDTYADNPHLSSTPGVISGHGWWGQGNCTSNKATVQNCLYEYYTDGTYRRKACGTANGIYPGGGSANRSAASRPCDSLVQSISWRNRVDVDVNGELDTSEVFERQAAVNCVINGEDQ